MDDLQSWLTGVAVTLIVTGIAGKLAPEKSNKSIINFVTTMVIIINLLGFDLTDIESLTEIEITTDIYQQEVLESEVNNKINQMLNNEITGEIEDTVKKYCSEARASITFDSQMMEVNISSKRLSDADKLRIENEIRDKFEGEILFIYTVVD